MIPSCYPSTLSTNFSQREMTIQRLTSVTGLVAWTDYIPIKDITHDAIAEGSTDSGGFIAAKEIYPTASQKKFTDYIPVYAITSPKKAWSTDVGGYIPIAMSGSGLAMAICRKYGASVYLPNVLNYSDNLGATPAVNDGAVGYVAGQRVADMFSASGVTAGVTGSGGMIAGLSASASVITGKAYIFNYTITACVGQLSASMNNVVNGTAQAVNWIGSFSEILIATSTGSIPIGLVSRGSGITSVTGSVTVRELGYIATQGTAGFKPQLVGGARNLLTYSEDMASGWTAGGATTKAGSQANPFGGITAAKVIGAGASCYFFQGASFVSGTVYTYSAYVKPIGVTSLNIQSFTQAGSSSFTLTGAGSTGATSGIESSPTIQALADGWYRISVVMTASATASNNIGVNAGTFTGDAFIIYGQQLEQSSTAGPYVPTTTAAASQGSRPKAWLFDSAQSQRMSLSGPVFQMTDDHFVVTCSRNDRASGASVVFAEAGSLAQRIGQIFWSNGQPQASWVDDAGTGAVTLVDAVSYLGQTKVVSARRSGSNFALRVNGTVKQSASNTPGATTIDSTVIGAHKAAAINFMQGPIYGLIAGKGTITDAEIIVLERWLGSLGGIAL